MKKTYINPSLEILLINSSNILEGSSLPSTEQDDVITEARNRDFLEIEEDADEALW